MVWQMRLANFSNLASEDNTRAFIRARTSFALPVAVPAWARKVPRLPGDTTPRRHRLLWDVWSCSARVILARRLRLLRDPGLRASSPVRSQPDDRPQTSGVVQHARSRPDNFVSLATPGRPLHARPLNGELIWPLDAWTASFRTQTRYVRLPSIVSYV